MKQSRNPPRPVRSKLEPDVQSRWRKLSELLPGGLDRNRSSVPSLALKLYQNWPDIIGRPAGIYTHPLEIKEGILVVGVQDHAWLNELRYCRDDLQTKISNFIGRDSIREVRFKLSPARQSAPESQAARVICTNCGVDYISRQKDGLCPICRHQKRQRLFSRLRKFLKQSPWAEYKQAQQAVGDHPTGDFESVRASLLDEAGAQIKRLIQTRTKQAYNQACSKMPYFIYLRWQKPPEQVTEDFLQKKLPAAWARIYVQRAKYCYDRR